MHSVTHGEGTPLLMIHGFCVDHRLLLSLEPVFAANGGWQRVYVDLPGMGQTPAGSDIDGSEAVVAGISAFIKETFGTRPFAVLGNSFGGLLARRVVSDFGEQVLGLALICPVVFPNHADRDVPVRTVLRRDPAVTESLDPEDAKDYGDMAVVESQENWELFRDHALPGLRAFDRRAIGRIAARYALDSQPESTEYPGPTLIIAGRQDHVVGYRDAFQLLGYYPRATISVLDGAGHNAHLDQPEVVRSLLDDWLDRMSMSRIGEFSS